MNGEIIIIAHNIRSLWNVGSLFRTSDAFAVQKIFLTGYTALPPRREISKTAIGAEEFVEWEHAEDPVPCIEQLRSEGFHIVALEKTDSAVNIEEYGAPQKICLIIGHEVTGVSDELLSLADDAVHIAMYGKKESLNVSVATGIALQRLCSSQS